jgi:hypothetical protein
MTTRGSFWIVATATADGLLYERLDQALAWAEGHDRQVTELFVGLNGRSIEGKTKAAVPAVTACFADLDLGGESIDEALAGLMSGSTPVPNAALQDSPHVLVKRALRATCRFFLFIARATAQTGE